MILLAILHPLSNVALLLPHLRPSTLHPLSNVACFPTWPLHPAPCPLHPIPSAAVVTTIHDCQLLEQDIDWSKMMPWDVPVDIIVTPTQVCLQSMQRTKHHNTGAQVLIGPI